MKKIVSILIVCIIAFSTVCCSSNEENVADLVVYGNIYTAENDNVVEAFAVKDGKYIFVGSKDDVGKYVKDGKTEIIDKTGQGLIIPGCTEGHSHYFSGTGLNTQLPGSGESYSKVLEILEEKVKTEEINQFVSFGWDSYELYGRRAEGDNFAEEIEKIAPGIPVVLIDNSGHGAVCNNTALQRAGVSESTVIRGGNVELDKYGKPNGYLSDQAVFYVSDKVITKPLTDEQYKNACLYGMNELLSLGYTNALDAFSNMFDPTALYAALKKMDDENELKINVSTCYNMKSYDFEIYRDKVDEIVEISENYSSAHLHSDYVKLFVDGVVEAGTGWITGEYNGVEDDKKHGNVVWNEDELNAIVEYANSKGLLIHAHTYGDAACKAAINAYIASNGSNGGQFRNCLAHVRNISLADVQRVAENNIPIAENLIWHTDYNEDVPAEKEIRDVIIGIVGEDLYNSGYPMKTLLDAGVIMSSSTDAPAAESVRGSIMNVVQVATTGVVPGESSKAFGASELISVKDALNALTINGAWQLGLEKERGSVKVGKYADFVILDKNILGYSGDQLKTIGETKILHTYFEGEKVYSAQQND